MENPFSALKGLLQKRHEKTNSMSASGCVIKIIVARKKKTKIVQLFTKIIQVLKSCFKRVTKKKNEEKPEKLCNQNFKLLNDEIFIGSISLSCD